MCGDVWAHEVESYFREPGSMSNSQRLYRIRANRRCRTHQPGTEIDFTGSRREVPPGWNVVRRYTGTNYVTDSRGRQFDKVEYR